METKRRNDTRRSIFRVRAIRATRRRDAEVSAGEPYLNSSEGFGTSSYRSGGDGEIRAAISHECRQPSRFTFS